MSPAPGSTTRWITHYLIKEYEQTDEGQDLVLRMEFAANLLKTLRARKMTNAEFCRKIGMKSPQFSRIIQGDENVTLAMVGRIVRALGYHPEIKFKLGMVANYQHNVNTARSGHSRKNHPFRVI